jgi:glycerol-1-phosphate dehydrogenase [NAD(P)+]
MRQITIPKNLKIADNYESLLEHLKALIHEENISSLSLICGAKGNELLADRLFSDIQALHGSMYQLKINKYFIDFSTYTSEAAAATELCEILAGPSCLTGLTQSPHMTSALGLGQGLCEEATGVYSGVNENSDTEWILGIGGGKMLDFAKYLSSKLAARFIAIPTLVSHDGICSPVAVIDGVSVGAVMPAALLVPLYIIEQSSEEHIKAGIGDLVANLSAIEDWKLANLHANTPIDDFAIMLSKQAAMTVIQSLKTYDYDIKNKNFLISLTEGLALSGIAMSIAGNSRPCSGAEHMISHAIDQIYGHGVKAMHGIQVAVATVFLQTKRNAEISQVRLSCIYEDLNLLGVLGMIDFPLSFSDIGIEDSDLDKIMALAPNTRPGRFTILDLLPVMP